MQLSRARSLAEVVGRPWVALPLLAAAWLLLLLFPGPLTALGAPASPLWVAGALGIAGALLLWRRPWSVNGLFALVLTAYAGLFALDFSTGLDSYCNAKVLIPIGDSAGYSFEAARVAAGKPYSEWAAAHVTSHSWFAALTFLSDRNLVLIHLLTGLFGALALSFAALEVRRFAGAIAAGLFLFAMLFFASSYVGTFASETYGIPMGLLAAGLLLRGASMGAEGGRWQMARLAALSFALAARPGALLVLPLAGCAVASLQEGWRRRLLSLFLAGLCALSGLAVNALLTKLLCEPATVPMSMDFWHHANGLLTGGSWNSSIASGSAEAARANVVKLLSEHPQLLFSASWKALHFFFAENVAFAFLPARWMGLAAGVLFGLGAAIALLRLREGCHRILLFSAAGLLLSTPFVPPWDAGIRPYAATVPLQFLLALVPVGAVASLFFGRLRRRENVTTPLPEGLSPAYPATLAGFVVVFGSLIPLLSLYTPLHLAKPQSWYWEGRMHVRLIPGSYVRIVPDSAAAHSRVPVLRRSDYLHPQPGFSWMFRADDEAIYSRMPSGVLLTRSDATGIVFVLKDDFGASLPESVDCEADLLRLRGDNMAFDKRIGFDVGLAAEILDSVYLPWLTGYDYYYHYHPVLGTLEFVENVPGGRLVVRTEKFGVLETSREKFPLFLCRDTGLWRRLDMDKKTFNEVK